MTVTPELLATLADRAMGPLGGFFITMMVCLWLAWELKTCKKQHAEQVGTNNRIVIAYVELGGAVNALTGREVLDVNSLADVMAGKPAVNYKVWTAKGRRRDDPPQEGNPPGGADNVR